ncbi:M23 family metallopeptidase [Leadbettera azotonutricia]|uniref:M23 family metallopeptidase n=1 Tax=Leadbettera azotonutricia TaxID=150829 RepID=UPI0002DC274E|nr:M23 family metallopeptidase [Leadbettera azotonutricia]
MPFFYFLLFVLPLLGAGENGSLSLPLILRLDSRDAIFKQYLSDVETARKRLFLAQIPPEAMAESLTVYAYVPLESDDILGLAARCNIPYAALATLNRLSHPEDLKNGEPLLLPSSPGLFIPEKPGNDLERLLGSSQREEGVWLFIGAGKTKTRFRFLPGEDLSPTERAFFLNKGFHYPLENFQVSSPYGPRVNPVTGRPGVHQGLDLASPEGAEVYAARDGVVNEQGNDPVFGNYIIISHGDNWVSLYGHLSKIETTLNQELRSGNLIGRVGSTGQSTGPHLHFELRQNGRARDPGRLLGIFR